MTYFDVIRFLNGTLVPKCLSNLVCSLDKQRGSGAGWILYPTSHICGLDGFTETQHFTYCHLTVAKYAALHVRGGDLHKGCGIQSDQLLVISHFCVFWVFCLVGFGFYRLSCLCALA